jgi:hypothetical protein
MLLPGRTGFKSNLGIGIQNYLPIPKRIFRMGDRFQTVYFAAANRSLSLSVRRTESCVSMMPGSLPDSRSQCGLR